MKCDTLRQGPERRHSAVANGDKGQALCVDDAFMSPTSNDTVTSYSYSQGGWHSLNVTYVWRQRANGATDLPGETLILFPIIRTKEDEDEAPNTSSFIPSPNLSGVQTGAT